MANTLQLKRSATAGKVPLTTNLALGELAFNTNDGRLYGKRNAGSDEIVEFLSTNSAFKTNVVAATTANVTVASAAPNTLDGVSLAANDRVLVKNQTAPAENGIYTVTTLGTGANGVWARAADCDTASDAAGAMVTVRAGTTQGGLTYTTSFKATDTLGTTAMNWTQLLSSAVSTISFGTTGLTPSSATSGAVTVAGTLVAANGGTGRTTARAAHAELNGAILSVTSAAGTTTLTATSPKKIIVTGSTTQTVVLPDVTTLLLGWEYEILNLSTGVVTVQSSGLNTIASVSQSASIKTTCILVTGTTAASWQLEWTGGNTRTGVGVITYAYGPAFNFPHVVSSNAFTAGTNAQGQGAITEGVIIVTTAAANPSGVTLPTPGTATQVRTTTIINRGANPVNVYPASGGTIDTLAANAAISLPVGGIMTFRNSSTTQWWSSIYEVNSAGVPTGSIQAFAGLTVPSGWLLCSGQSVSRTTYAALFAALSSNATITVTIATPGVVTWTGHTLVNGSPVTFNTTGALPTGITAGTTYYVINQAADTFQIAATVGGAAIATSGTQSGVHTCYFVPHGTVAAGTTVFNVPDLRGRVPAGLDNMGGTAANRLTSAGSGVLGTVLGNAGGAETHTLTTAQLAVHTHAVQTTSDLSGGGSRGGPGGTTNSSGNAGSGSAHNNTQPTVIVNYIIKT